MIIRLIIILLLIPGFIKANESINVAYASSLHQAMKTIINGFQKETNISVKYASGSSGLLAKQITLGAPFDIFISANDNWINFLNKKMKSNKIFWVSNGLLLIHKKESVDLNRFLMNQNEKFCIADPKQSPLGMHSQEVLNHYRINIPKNNLIVVKDSATLKSYSLIGECDFSISYSSDLSNYSEKFNYEFIDNKTFTQIQYFITNLSNSKLSNKFINYLLEKNNTRVLENHGFIIRE